MRSLISWFIWILVNLVVKILAVLLLTSSYVHLSDSYQFLHALLKYNLLPVWLTPLVAATLPSLQLVLGVSLVFVPALRRTALLFSLAIFITYSIAQILVYRQGLEIPCGCFGDSTKLISIETILIPCIAAIASFLAWLTLFIQHRKSQSKSTPPATQNTPSRTGFTILELLVVIAIIAIVIGLLLTAVQKVRHDAARLQCQNQLRQLALAVHQFHSARQQFPPGLSIESDRRQYTYLSWQARSLPYLEQQPLWSQIEFAFATDPAPMIFYGHPPHAALMATPVKLLHCPSDPRLGQSNVYKGILISHTSYLGLQGTNQSLRDGLFYLDSHTRLADITDGTSNTLMIGERPPDSQLRFGWWYRGWGQQQDGSCEMLLGVREINRKFPECPAAEGNFKPGKLTDFCDVLHFWSLHSAGANFALADGSIRFLTYSADAILPSLASRSGGEALSVP